MLELWDVKDPSKLGSLEESNPHRYIHLISQSRERRLRTAEKAEGKADTVG